MRLKREDKLKETNEELTKAVNEIQFITDVEKEYLLKLGA